MSTYLIDKYVEKVYDSKINEIELTNDAFERDYFEKNYYRIPNGELLNGLSFNDHLKRFKDVAKDGDFDTLNTIFESLRDFFFFSAGKDMIYRKKIEANSFREVPMKNIIFPIILDDIHSKYSSDRNFKPNGKVFNRNVDNMINNGILISTFLYYLYCDDFIPTNDMKRKFPSSYADIVKKLSNLSITIGDYLRELVKMKCQKMKDVFSNVKDDALRNIMYEKVDFLMERKFDEINSLYNCNLHICYFFNHSVYEFINSSDFNSNNSDDYVKKYGSFHE